MNEGSFHEHYMSFSWYFWVSCRTAAGWTFCCFSGFCISISFKRWRTTSLHYYASLFMGTNGVLRVLDHADGWIDLINFQIKQVINIQKKTWYFLLAVRSNLLQPVQPAVWRAEDLQYGHQTVCVTQKKLYSLRTFPHPTQASSDRPAYVPPLLMPLHDYTTLLSLQYPLCVPPC